MTAGAASAGMDCIALHGHSAPYDWDLAGYGALHQSRGWPWHG